MTNEEKQRAIENSEPKMVIRIELGGDYYFKCPWIICNETIKREWNYCPACGQHLKFPEEE